MQWTTKYGSTPDMIYFIQFFLGMPNIESVPLVVMKKLT